VFAARQAATQTVTEKTEADVLQQALDADKEEARAAEEKAEAVEEQIIQIKAEATQAVTVVQEKEIFDLFVFNDTIEGPRVPAVKPGRVTQA
jgi:deferrochelatase/peroxidase EfeB